MGKHIGFLIMNIEGRGGTERVTSMVATALVKKGYEVSIISCRYGSMSHFDLDEKVTLYSMHGEKIRNSIWRKACCYRALKQIITEHKMDIMIAVDVALYIYLWPLQRSGLCRCVAWEHFHCDVVPNTLVRLARWMSAKQADCVVVLEKKDHQNYKRHYKNIKRIECIYNPLTFSAQQSADISKKRVIAVGRLTEEKGFDRLIDIWKLVEKDLPDWSLDIYGEGDQKQSLLDQIASYDLQHIHLKGYSKDIRQEYLDSSIFVLTSRYEGFGLVLIEAQACGLPIVSFDCKEGPGEIVRDHINGYLIEDGNRTKFAEKLRDLMFDDEKRKRFSDNSKSDLAKYHIDTVINRWMELLETL